MGGLTIFERWKMKDTQFYPTPYPEKIIFPRGVKYSNYGRGDSFSVHYGPDYIDDLDRIVRVLDCKPPDFDVTIKNALRDKFKSNLETRKNGGDYCETEYFSLRYFKKGTLHITFKRIDLLQKINIIGTDGKTDIPNMRH